MRRTVRYTDVRGLRCIEADMHMPLTAGLRGGGGIDGVRKSIRCMHS